MGLFEKKIPKDGSFKLVNGHYYIVRKGKWVKASPEVNAQMHKGHALNQANVGGTHTLFNKNQPKANLNRSKVEVKSKDNNNKSKPKYKKGPVVKSVGTIDFNINTKAGLTSYNKALKASKGKKTDKERDKASNVALKKERDSNRNKLSANKNFQKLSLSNNKGDKPSSTVHTRHYKTGERLGVMTRSQRRAYEKEAGDKTFGQRVAEHEKSSGHGKPHLRETKYKASVRKGKTTNGSNNRNNLTVKDQHKIKLKEQQNKTAEQMQGDPRYKGPKFKKNKR